MESPVSTRIDNTAVNKQSRQGMRGPTKKNDRLAQKAETVIGMAISQNVAA